MIPKQQRFAVSDPSIFKGELSIPHAKSADMFTKRIRNITLALLFSHLTKEEGMVRIHQ
jgi:hypothetical protein